jgi:uncharacterized protein YdeI (BOF family)
MPYKDHYVKKKIEEINPETDLKVNIMGFVVDKKEDTFILDDGSKKIKVFMDNPVIAERINVNQLVRVFGSTLPTDEGFEIKADVVQDLSNLNIDLYKKVEGLYSKMGV